MPLKTRILVASWAVSILSGSGTYLSERQPLDRNTMSLSFRIVVDGAQYAPGSTLDVQFLVTNKSQAAIYVPRHLSQCSGQFGFIYFQILDQRGRDTTQEGCSADSWPLPSDDELVKIVSDPKAWILLTPGEVYGSDSTFELPKMRGMYSLRAKLMPPALSDAQAQRLASKGTPVLHEACDAPLVTITVR